MPPETEHFVYENEVYCTDCIEVVPYTAHQYYLNGEFIGDSEACDNVDHIESYDDDYEGDED